VKKQKGTELKRGAPPPSARRQEPGRPAGQVYKNLEQLAETPDEWGQISSHSTKVAARQVVYHLRSGQRKAPPGNWELVYGPVNEEDPKSQWGVWARLVVNGKEGDSVTTDAG
jgi:hypothetical protein